MPSVAITEVSVRASASTVRIARPRRVNAPRKPTVAGRGSRAVAEAGQPRAVSASRGAAQERRHRRPPGRVKPGTSGEHGHAPTTIAATTSRRTGSEGGRLRGGQERCRGRREDRRQQPAGDRAERDAHEREPELLDEEDAGDLARRELGRLQVSRSRAPARRRGRRRGSRARRRREQEERAVDRDDEGDDLGPGQSPRRDRRAMARGAADRAPGRAQERVERRRGRRGGRRRRRSSRAIGHDRGRASRPGRRRTGLALRVGVPERDDHGARDA